MFKIKYYFVFFICFTISISVSAQSIKNINWVKDSTKIVLYYDIVSLIKGTSYNVDIFCSTDGGETYNVALKTVLGDIGNDITIGRNKTLIWDVFKDVGGLAGNVSFKVVAEQNPRKRDYFISYNGSMESFYGFQAGMLGGISPYVSLRFNAEVNAKHNYVFDDNTLIVDYPYNEIYFIYGDKVKKPRFALNAGATIQLFNNAYVYLGAGYGKSYLLWEVNEFNYSDDKLAEVSWAINNNWSIKGAEVEAGLILPLKSLLFTTGVTTTNFRRPSLTFGLGYKFN